MWWNPKLVSFKCNFWLFDMTTGKNTDVLLVIFTSCLNLNATKALKDCSDEAKLDTFFHTSSQKCEQHVCTKFNSNVAYILSMFWKLYSLIFILPPFKKKKKKNFFSSLPEVDVGGYSSTFISGAYEPDMIYAVPLTSLAQSSITSSSLCPPSSPLCSPSLLCRALYLTGIRVARQTTSATARRGKPMKRSSWQTMWGFSYKLWNN